MPLDNLKTDFCRTGLEKLARHARATTCRPPIVWNFGKSETPEPRPTESCSLARFRLGVSDKTVSRYLDILEGTYMAFRLLPWHANVGKREIKSPKGYVSDTGLLHSLLGIARHEDLLAHPKCGASSEGAIIRELLHRFDVQRGEAFF